jgi:hypothetical protein
MWGWVSLKYSDGVTFVFESGEWGKPYPGPKGGGKVSLDDLDEEARKKVAAMPDLKPAVTFGNAVRKGVRDPVGVEAAHRSATLLHLANIAIRVGRKIQYDPVKEQIIGDEEANRLVNQPMRAPWRL